MQLYNPSSMVLERSQSHLQINSCRCLLNTSDTPSVLCAKHWAILWREHKNEKDKDLCILGAYKTLIHIKSGIEQTRVINKMLWEHREEKKILTREIWEGFLEKGTKISRVRLLKNRKKTLRGEAVLAKSERQENAGHQLYHRRQEILVVLCEMQER